MTLPNNSYENFVTGGGGLKISFFAWRQLWTKFWGRRGQKWSFLALLNIQTTPNLSRGHAGIKPQKDIRYVPMDGNNQVIAYKTHNLWFPKSTFIKWLHLKDIYLQFCSWKQLWVSKNRKWHEFTSCVLKHE